MAFWQSREWLDRVDSLYELSFEGGDPDFMPWWKEAWILFKRRNAYDVVLTMGVRESFGFAALCWIFRSTCCHVMTEIFIDSPRRFNPLWHLKNRCYRFLAIRAAGIITNSSEEILTNAKRYNISADRFQYIPLNTTIDQPELVETNDGYYLCAGRTLRDYKTLTKVIAKTEKPWIIIAGALDMKDVALPDRVTVHREIDREAYLDILRRADVVVLPLLQTERATGQVVVLEAMSYGKAVITTDAPGTRDIVRNGHNGFLVPTNGTAEIIRLLEQLESEPELKAQVGQNAIRDIETIFSTEEHTKARLEAIESFWKLWTKK